MRSKESFVLFILFFTVHAQGDLNNLIDSNNEFCLSLLRTIPENQNVFFSPASIYIALGMLYAGAGGTTADVMEEVLNYEKAGMTENTIHLIFGELIRLMNNTSTDYVLQLANVLLYQQDSNVQHLYKEILRNFYGALVKEIDITHDNEAAVEEINNWVKKTTNDKIPKLIDDIPPEMVMILLNSIYFKGSWKQKFDPEFTRNAIFYNDGTDPVTVSMMNMEGEFPLGWFPSKGVKAVELPYEGDLSMLILLPFEFDKLTKLEKYLDLERLYLIISDMEIYTSKLDITLPKFKLEDSRMLKENLTHLGLGNLFNIDADFSGISVEKNLYVSDVLHTAAIEVNEEGSEAAVATGIEMVVESAFPFFYANHPFLFFIRDHRTNMILFAGRVTRL